MIKALEKLALDIEAGLNGDDEIEISVFDGNICICRYSPTRGGAETEKVFCPSTKIVRKSIVRLCNKHKWAYVL